VHWLNLFAKFSVTERTAGISGGAREEDLTKRWVWLEAVCRRCMENRQRPLSTDVVDGGRNAKLTDFLG